MGLGSGTRRKEKETVGKKALMARTAFRSLVRSFVRLAESESLQDEDANDFLRCSNSAANAAAAAAVRIVSPPPSRTIARPMAAEQISWLAARMTKFSERVRRPRPPARTRPPPASALDRALFLRLRGLPWGLHNLRKIVVLVLLGVETFNIEH